MYLHLCIINKVLSDYLMCSEWNHFGFGCLIHPFLISFVCVSFLVLYWLSQTVHLLDHTVLHTAMKRHLLGGASKLKAHFSRDSLRSMSGCLSSFCVRNIPHLSWKNMCCHWPCSALAWKWETWRSRMSDVTWGGPRLWIKGSASLPYKPWSRRRLSTASA